jgi:transposase
LFAADRAAPPKGSFGTRLHLQAHFRPSPTTPPPTLCHAPLDGRVIGRCMDKHRHQEFIRFLGTIDADKPADLDLYLIMDYYGTHKHAEVAAWLERHLRFRLHFMPTASSWLNMVERFFAEITCKRMRRGVFKSVTDLEVVIYRYLAEHNDHPKPFVWTATTKDILAKFEKAKTTLREVTGTNR